MSSNFNYSITFPCLNSLDYTKKLIGSMLENEEDMSKVVAVNNGSTDSTEKYLKSIRHLNVINNKKNYGFGVPLNQGAMKLRTEWTIFMNNDVIVSKGWIEGLLSSAEENNLKVISPAMIEESYDYDINEHSNMAKLLFDGYVRNDDAHAVCIAIHESVLFDIGYFRPTPSLFGYEDKIFFNELRRNNINTGITSSSWIHHYGSVTQKAMKEKAGILNKNDLSNNSHSKILCENFLSRKYLKYVARNKRKNSVIYEIDNFGMSLIGRRLNKNFVWKNIY